MISFLYSVVHGLLFALSIPFWLYQLLVHKKYRKSTLRRFSFDQLRPTAIGEECFLIHAVSVGEVSAIQPLIEHLHKEKPGARIVISTITETGADQAKKLFPKLEHLYFPFDFRWCCRHVLHCLKPKLVILSEGDLWFNFLKEASRVVIVNGKMSEKSFKRFCLCKPFARALFSNIDLICAQSNCMKQRFEAFLSPNKIIVTGSLKGAVSIPPLSEEKRKQYQQKLSLRERDIVLVCASTHEHEEKILLNALTNLLNENAQAKIIVVPRHPERFQTVTALATTYPFVTAPLSTLTGIIEPRIIVADQMGILTELYQLATIAICGGSFVSKIGGHNILEPIFLGIPTICGPYMHSQTILIEEALSHHAVRQVTLDDLPTTVASLLHNEQERKTLQKNGNTLKTHLQGSLKRTISTLYNNGYI